MKWVRSFLIFFLLLSLGFGETPSPLNLMPWPAEVHRHPGRFYLTDSFYVQISGAANDALYRYTSRIVHWLSGRTGLFFPMNNIKTGDSRDSVSFRIHCQRIGKVQLGEDESYTLRITRQGILLKAPTTIGAMRGLETFLQLLDADSTGYFFPQLEIRDKPRFPWRGLLIDVARHFMPPEVIKRNLDGMAAVKMNVLHWHLSDDQGFRVESKRFPRLHGMGSDGNFYTQEQIREIVRYAAERGIRVVPEFDVPGHATSWLVGYPELGSAPGPYKLERHWGIFYPALNPASDTTYAFLDAFFAEMASLFPDAYFHIGGDELEHGVKHPAKHWNENPQVQKLKQQEGLADNAAVQAYFNRRIQRVLARHGKIMVGWDEILHSDLPRSVVIQSWRGRKAMIKAARMGFRSILSNGYYIDLIYPASRHYLNDPLPQDIPLNEEQRQLILGGEATMWAEFVSPETIDSRIWPRTAAIAERLWSPNSVRNVREMYRRLEILSLQLEERGLTHEKNYPMLLRRLARYRNIAPLKTLVDVLEPVKGYQRPQLRQYTSLSPLTRVVDAARPDAPVARHFRWDVEEYLRAGKHRDSLRQSLVNRLVQWKENHASLQKLIRISPVLREVEPLSVALMRVATIGLEAVNAIASNRALGERWWQRAKKVLQEAQTPHGESELVIVSAIEQLARRAATGDTFTIPAEESPEKSSPHQNPE